jgi:hypothetical protein
VAGLKKLDNQKLSTWIKRLGFVGFIFFLLKGLAWLAIFFGMGKVLGL